MVTILDGAQLGTVTIEPGDTLVTYVSPPGFAGTDEFDYVVTDPPYGMRQARRVDLARLYTEWLQSFERVLAPAGRIALIVVKHRTLRRALQSTSLQVAHERRIGRGGFEPWMFVFERA